MEKKISTFIIITVKLGNCHCELLTVWGRYNSKRKEKKWPTDIGKKSSQLKHVLQGQIQYTIPRRKEKDDSEREGTKLKGQDVIRH